MRVTSAYQPESTSSVLSLLQVGLLAADTIKNHLTAITAWHIYNDNPWQGRTCLHYIPPNLPLFSYHSSHSWHCLIKKKLLSHCNSIWSLSRIPSTAGHSFCIGGADKIQVPGAPPDVVKALGGWSSDTFLCYWHSLDRLAERERDNWSPSNFEDPGLPRGLLECQNPRCASA
ncbi:hypothetical protein PAXRUDRAFT_796457 [Paxillus rubicundulus Ve08.2h10]|uniref:Uncharacterized protein n=1 Tax=Paxillus rubicundulus Ve08.2h10 TaxID=930991 RepID=A0A0D0CZV1_9AGAM|nr:hypothetical protein PAXRUDRAFT_796457 [Paxillus rubicundulus Ve08.2h10]